MNKSASMLQLVESPKMLMLLTLETDGVSPETELASEDVSEEPHVVYPCCFLWCAEFGGLQADPSASEVQICIWNTEFPYSYCPNQDTFLVKEMLLLPMVGQQM